VIIKPIHVDEYVRARKASLAGRSNSVKMFNEPERIPTRVELKTAAEAPNWFGCFRRPLILVIVHPS
jgi:hypothetical protein